MLYDIKEPLYGWHLLNKEGRTILNNLPVTDGQTLTVYPAKVGECAGLFASYSLLEAFSAAPPAGATWVEYVRLDGVSDIPPERFPFVSALCATKRTTLWSRNVHDDMSRFLIDMQLDPGDRKVLDSFLKHVASGNKMMLFFDEFLYPWKLPLDSSRDIAQFILHQGSFEDFYRLLRAGRKTLMAAFQDYLLERYGEE